MAKQLTRHELHALCWETPITKLAKAFGISDVALHKICRKHRIPTPPAGHWAKKLHGKSVRVIPLPDPGDECEIHIAERSASREPLKVAEARIGAQASTGSLTSASKRASQLVADTIARLRKAPRDRDGLIHAAGGMLVRTAIRPATCDRAKLVLLRLIGAGEAAGLELAKGTGGACWTIDGEQVGFELVEVPDQVEHVATRQELAAVERWERERQERHRRTGYLSEWGEPKIPKWDQVYKGRLAIKLEEVRILRDDSWCSDAMRRTFSDTRTKDIFHLIPRVIAAVAAMAAAKKHNRGVEARRLAAEEKARAEREELERLRFQHQKAQLLVGELVVETARIEQARGLLSYLESCGPLPSRTAGFLDWLREDLLAAERRISVEVMEQRLAKADLFRPAP